MNKMLKKSEVVALATGISRPSRDEAEAAVRTLIRWAGDNPDREGLVGTPDRVVRSYEEFFAGYDEDPRENLRRTFEEVEGYDEVVVLRDIRLESYCEHHMVPIIGKVHIGYLPDKRVVGKTPRLRPGEVFEYTSGTSLSTPSGFMGGTYQMVSESGENFDIEIPTFSLDTPGGSRQLN